MDFPTLRTQRLVLRAFAPADAPRVQELAGAREVAATTLSIQHPYEPGMAEAWIAGHGAAWEGQTHLSLAVTTEADGVVGAIGLVLSPAHRRAEIGYWIGVPYWGRGYATEAAVAVIDFGFRELGLHRIVGQYFARNPASGSVLLKAGMKHEGTLREHTLKWDEWLDVEYCGVLASEWSPPGAATVRSDPASPQPA